MPDEPQVDTSTLEMANLDDAPASEPGDDSLTSEPADNAERSALGRKVKELGDKISRLDVDKMNEFFSRLDQPQPQPEPQLPEFVTTPEDVTSIIDALDN